MQSEIIFSHKFQEKWAWIWYQLGHPAASRRQKSDATRTSPAPGHQILDFLMGPLRPCYSKGGLWTGSTNIPTKLVKRQHLRHPQEPLNPNLCLHRCTGDLCPINSWEAWVQISYPLFCTCHSSYPRFVLDNFFIFQFTNSLLCSNFLSDVHNTHMENCTEHKHRAQ